MNNFLIENLDVINAYRKVNESDSSDSVYMDAVRRGDLATAQKMVDKAAKSAGYNIGPMYHGTRSSFSTFDKSLIGNNYSGYNIGGGFWFSSNPEYARRWGIKAAGSNPVKVFSVFLKINNPIKEIKGKPLSDMLRDAHKTNSGDGMVTDMYNYPHLDAVVFDPTQIKSAEVVCRDDSGEIIPLSKRFDSSSMDIREDSEDLDSAYVKAVEGKDSDEIRRLVDKAAEKLIKSIPVSTNKNPIPNSSSISSSLSDYEIFGVREVPIGWFQTGGIKTRYSVSDVMRIKELMELIKRDGVVSPLIVVVDGDKDGIAYILEGGHRFDAIWELGLTSFPALVIYDNDSEAIIRDDSGKIIPLSKRFDRSSSNIRE